MADHFLTATMFSLSANSHGHAAANLLYPALQWLEFLVRAPSETTVQVDARA